jgi:hypothetical protein
MGKFRIIKQNAPRGRSVFLSQFLCDAIHKTLRTPKKLVKSIIDSAMIQLKLLLEEDGIDVIVNGIGRISSEPLCGKEFIVKGKNLITEYPPGSYKIKFTAHKLVKQKSRPRFIKSKADGVIVNEWYKHLYNSDGTANYDVDPVVFFDSGIVMKKMIEAMSHLNGDKEDG